MIRVSSNSPISFLWEYAATMYWFSGAISQLIPVFRPATKIQQLGIDSKNLDGCVHLE